MKFNFKKGPLTYITYIIYMLILFKEKAHLVLTAETLELKSTLKEVGCYSKKTPTPHITYFTEMNSDFLVKNINGHAYLSIRSLDISSKQLTSLK